MIGSLCRDARSITLLHIVIGNGTMGTDNSPVLQSYPIGLYISDAIPNYFEVSRAFYVDALISEITSNTVIKDLYVINRINQERLSTCAIAVACEIIAIDNRTSTYKAV